MPLTSPTHTLTYSPMGHFTEFCPIILAAFSSASCFLDSSCNENDREPRGVTSP